jgi:hypothetical protein
MPDLFSLDNSVMAVIEGAAPTVKVAGAEVTGPGFKTVMLNEPGLTSRDAGTAAVS